MKRPSEKFINQYRSWNIMEEYFGVKYPHSSTIGFDKLPPHLQNLLSLAKEKMQPNINKVKSERAKLN